ncbi:hypothetical protein MKEN_00281200 [Mycena kentingensis (nom. inval.)]|nr:hypothetical protein MKEN_00281200 [Mycena kentingensis (nom. inval.)]
MKISAIALVALAIATGASAAPAAMEKRASKEVQALAAKQDKLQFVTGKCAKDAECQQGCCAFTTGKCAGPGIAQTRDGGCGFGNAKPNCDVATALKLNTCAKGADGSNLKKQQVQQAAAFCAQLNNLPFTPAAGVSASKSGSSSDTSKPGNDNSTGGNTASSSSGGVKSISELAAKQNKLQFVTGKCSKDGECQQGCCAFTTGKCAGPGIAQTRDGGCGFGDAKPNCDVATALNLGVCAKGGDGNNAKNVEVQQAAAFCAQLNGLPFSPA